MDLLIRAGGERRLSDFLLWEAAYAELYFTRTMWPQFGARELRRALAAYARRERRFGAAPAAAVEAVLAQLSARPVSQRRPAADPLPPPAPTATAPAV
ncbi:MAG: undecaprenyl diphosphate synthase family protein [Terriglobales bacterium]